MVTWTKMLMEINEALAIVVGGVWKGGRRRCQAGMTLIKQTPVIRPVSGPDSYPSFSL